MANKFQKQVKKMINETTNVFPDKMVCHGDGTISIKRGYFYRHGQTEEGWGDKVMAEVSEIADLIEVWDDYRTWPRDSYFVARVGPKA